MNLELIKLENLIKSNDCLMSLAVAIEDDGNEKKESGLCKARRMLRWIQEYDDGEPIKLATMVSFFKSFSKISQ